MTNDHGASSDEVELGEHTWLYDHIGRIAGVILGALAFGFLAFLAVIGSTPASGLVVIVLVGIAILVIGGWMRGS